MSSQHRFKIIGVFVLISALTVTLAACDMGDDADPTMYELTVEMEGEGSVYEDGEELLTEEEESETIDAQENTSVTLEAEPADDWEFSEWTGDEESEDEEISVPIDENKGVTANFYEEYAEIDSADGLNNIRENLDGNYRLTDDIDMSEYDNWEPIGDEDNPFTGNFDGDGYEIRNLNIDKETADYVGLFGYLSKAIISNVNLVELQNIIGYDYVGGLVGYVDEGQLINIRVEDNIYGNEYIGGLIGYNDGEIINSNTEGSIVIEDNHSVAGGLVGRNDGVIKNSYSIGEITGKGSLGGLVGENQGSIKKSYSSRKITGPGRVGGLVGEHHKTIEESYAKGNVIGEDYTGGLIGQNGGFGHAPGEIVESYAAGDVTGEDYIGGFIGSNRGDNIKSYAEGDIYGGDVVGGFIGRNQGYIDTSFAKGAVKGVSRVGGMIGHNYHGDIQKSFSTGRIQGNNEVGGFVGKHEDERILNSYSSGGVTGDEEVGGFVGVDEGLIGHSYYDKGIAGIDEENGIPKPTDEMIQQDTFTPEWDFDDIWTIEEDDSYPYFQWQDDENIPYPPE